jgi:hypothetical protein
MRNREKQDENLTPLTVLVEEKFAGTVGALVDVLAERGIAVTTDTHGRLAVAVPAATTLREEQAEQERQAAAEAARAAAEAAERQRVAREAAAVEEADVRRQREAQARRQDHIRRLEAASGVSIVELEIGLRRSLLTAPDVGWSHADRQRLEDRAFTLDELEAFVLQTYGVDSLEEVGR